MAKLLIATLVLLIASPCLGEDHIEFSIFGDRVKFLAPENWTPLVRKAEKDKGMIMFEIQNPDEEGRASTVIAGLIVGTTIKDETIKDYGDRMVAIALSKEPGMIIVEDAVNSYGIRKVLAKRLVRERLKVVLHRFAVYRAVHLHFIASCSMDEALDRNWIDDLTNDIDALINTIKIDGNSLILNANT